MCFLVDAPVYFAVGRDHRKSEGIVADLVPTGVAGATFLNISVQRSMSTPLIFLLKDRWVASHLNGSKSKTGA